MKSVIEPETRRQVRLLRLPEVLARTRVRSIVRLDEGRFPRPVSLDGHVVGWIDAQVDEWIRERIAEGRSDTE